MKSCWIEKIHSFRSAAHIDRVIVHSKLRIADKPLRSIRIRTKYEKPIGRPWCLGWKNFPWFTVNITGNFFSQQIKTKGFFIVYGMRGLLLVTSLLVATRTILKSLFNRILASWAFILSWKSILIFFHLKDYYELSNVAYSSSIWFIFKEFVYFYRLIS